MLFKEIVDARTDARTHGRRTPDIEGSQKLTEHFVLRWAKNEWSNQHWSDTHSIPKHGMSTEVGKSKHCEIYIYF